MWNRWVKKIEENLKSKTYSINLTITKNHLINLRKTILNLTKKTNYSKK